MSDAFRDILADWTLPLYLTAAIILTAVIYVRGWLAIRKTRPEQFTYARLTSFLSGLALLWLSIGSPMDGMADALLSAHMIEHLFLMSIIPPLLLCGWPLVPLLRGLPKTFRRRVVGPIMRVRNLRRFGDWLVTPVVAWFAFNVTFIAWHIPNAYNFALEHEFWHDVEHLCFLGTALLFWWVILRPWPASKHRQGWWLLLYLLTADVVNTLLSVFLAFCGRPVYTFYATNPNPFHVSLLGDQVLGAVIMWVFGSFAFIIPALWLSFKLLQPAGLRRPLANDPARS